MIFKENKPIYLQIADRIMDEILNNTYPEGERIPSVREYAATVEVNANTVVKSFDYLQSDEIIFNKRGLGYFVAEGAVQKIISNRKDTFLNDELPEMFVKLKQLDISMNEVQTMFRDWLKMQKQQS
ncbi:MAG: GntR family transcriptional regulator [Bacteroidaceae bacterium]|nr:GntR family transcriptional regulator [Bacteroidaceae bacterium]